MANSIYQIAKSYAHAGLSVIPLKLDGSKAPALSWDAYKTTIAGDDTLRGWFSQGNHGIGIIGGAVSGNLERIDFDLPGSCKKWADLAKECGYGELVNSLPLVRTPRSKQCYHLYYRCESPIEGNQPLARYLDSEGKIKVAIETRGEGGYTIAPGSPTEVHETGNPYVLVRGDLQAIPVISTDDRVALLEMARSFNEYVPDKQATTAQPDRERDGAPGNDYNARGDWRQVLRSQGWSEIWTKGEVEYWRRPGKAKGISATWNYKDSEVFYVFSTNALPFEPERSYTPFGIYATVSHDGDYKRAAKALADEDYGNPAKAPPIGEVSSTQDRTTDFPLTDLGNAERLIAHHGTNLRYNVDCKQWLIWSGKRWEVDSTGEVDRLARQTIRGIADEIASIYAGINSVSDTSERDRMRKRAESLSSHMKSSESKQRLDAMVSLAKYCAGVPVTANQLDADGWLLNCTNGTIDLRTGKLKPYDPHDLITKMCPVDYDPHAKCPTWERVISEIFAGDGDLVAFVQRAIGYSMTTDTSEQGFFLLHGDGANGKSTMLNAISDILADYARSTSSETLTQKKNKSVRDYESIGRLMGARFVSAVETDVSQHLAEGLLKSLTGQDVQTGAFLFGATFEFKPSFKLFLACNHRPIITGDDWGVWRRVRLVPFTVQFDGDKRDAMLPDKLRLEYCGILRWMLEGCLKWQSQGLGTCKAVFDATEGYRREQDKLSDFLDDRCTLSPDAQIPSGQLYSAYRQWCSDNGVRMWSNKLLTQKLQKRGGLELIKTRTANVWIGIDLNTENSDDNSTLVDDMEHVEAKTYNSLHEEKYSLIYDSPSTCSTTTTPERKKQEDQQETDTPIPHFGNENDCLDWESLTTANSSETVNSNPLSYTCGQCKQPVELAAKNRNVYQYECLACGHHGVVPHYDYRLWQERQTVNG